MAKMCPITKEKVLYLECLECEQKGKCKQLSKKIDKQSTCNPISKELEARDFSRVSVHIN